MTRLEATGWLTVLRRYALFAAIANLGWEAAHVSLYTVGVQGTRPEIAAAIRHCTAADVVLAFSCLGAALAVAGSERWPRARFGAVAAVAVVIGVAYTIYSERLNLARGSWSYTEAMPTLPAPFGTGLTPLLQWIVLPPIGLFWARRGVDRGDPRPGGRG